jgi:TatD DNase family protein
MLIDTHCHLNFKVFKNDWRAVIGRAQKAGVRKMVVVGTDLESSRRAVEIANGVKGVYATVGLHPHHCRGLKSRLENIKGQLKILAKNKKVVAIGECGLDYHVYKQSEYKDVRLTTELKNLQKRAWGMQIQLAKELNLPMVIHNRRADEELLDTLEHFCKDDGKYPKGVFHCISGSKKYLARVLKMGFYVGVDGNVTYSQGVQELAKEIPVERLVIETDSPFLTPKPYRGLRNEPKNVKIVTEFLGKLKKLTFDQIEASTTRNAEAVFKLK